MSKTSHLRGWRIVADRPDEAALAYFQSVMTLGNGLLGIRGSREEASPDGLSRPLTLMAEVYDRPSCPPGLPRKYRPTSRLAPMPNPLFIDFDDGDGRLSTNPAGIMAEKLTLDMKAGVLERKLRYHGPGGRVTRITSRRLVSQARPNVVAISYSITPENYSGSVVLTSALDATVKYPDEVRQTVELYRGRYGNTIWLLVRTCQSRIQIAQVARHRLTRGGRAVNAATTVGRDEGRPGLAFEFDAVRGRPVTLEKVISIHNSLRQAEPLSVAKIEAVDAPPFATLLGEHAAAWADYWRDCDILIEGDRVVQTMARFWVFQLLQAASKNNVSLGLSASIPAKTLSGWGYGGRVFWDTEIYMLPFFSQQYPEIARSLLMYRHDRLDAAKRLADRCRCQGIKFPWESGDTGQEECPKWLPLKDGTGRWERWRGGEQQVHINADVPFAFWQHWLATGDYDLLVGPGLDILVGTARYWASRVRKRRRDNRTSYVIRWVIGPDENHQCVHNNVYTNAMARWNLRQAADLLESLDGERGRAAMQRLGLSRGEIARWREIAEAIQINFDPATGLYEQFDGYFKDADPTLKQADLLLALHLLPELAPTGEILRRNFDHYQAVTTHGSSLSPCAHVLFALDVGQSHKAYEYELQSCAVDGVFEPGRSEKGLHAAALGGGWSSIVAGFGGVRVGPDCLEVQPRLPARWRRLTFSIQYRGLRLRFDIRPSAVRASADAAGAAVNVRLLGQLVTLNPGQQVERRGRVLPSPPDP